MKVRNVGIVAIAVMSILLTQLTFTANSTAKEKIASITDLPVRTYPTDVAPSQLVTDDAAMAELREKVRTDVEKLLQDYEIDDKATLQRFYGVLSRIALLDHRDEDALNYVEKVRDLEDKESAKLMGGLSTAALVAAREAGDPGSEAYESAFREAYDARLADMPWDVVQDQVQATKGWTEIASKNMILGMIQSQMDETVAETGELSDEMAEGLIGMQLTLKDFLPLRDLQVASLQAKIDANRVEKENIWPARDVILDPAADDHEVLVGIWDSGVDANVFGEQMWTNPGEVYNGVDDDGNGFVDDIHGIAYDMFGARNHNLLHPQGDQTGRVEAAMQYMKGMMDLQAAIDSKEARELKQHLASLEPARMGDFMTALGFVGLYAHGTHVAGIATDGNPFAKVLCARIAFDYHPKPAPILLSSAKAHAASYAETVKYFQDAGVRVVNMSWGWTFDEIRGSLEANGIGKTAEERKAMTEKIFGTLDEGLRSAMASAPDILFCVAAGNDDNDVAFNRVIPSSYELENIMVVGAVDQAGERTSFTSMGKNVVVYANGFEVMSHVPGGGEMALSGTSMASPNAANLAAKVLAVDPALTPPQVISVIEGSADELEGQPGLKIINPKRTIERVEQLRASR
jgi:subtilisin family serine protease